MEKEIPASDMTKNSSSNKQSTNSGASGGSSKNKRQAQRDMYNERNNKPEVPDCDCFSSDKKPPEPGSYYTHLGKYTFVHAYNKRFKSFKLN